MGLFDRNRPNVRDQYERGSHSSWAPRWTSPPERNTAEWLQAFNDNPRLAVVERIASDLSFATGKLFAIAENGDEKELAKHPFLTFWQNPNPLHEMSNAALWRLLEIYLMLKGEGYFAMEKDALGRPVEIWPVPTHWVQMTPYVGNPFYTVRLTNGTLTQISVDDMFVMKDLNPADPYKRGHGQAEPLADEIETDEYAAKFQKKFFYNDATPNLIIAMPKSTDEQRTRFRMEWLERFRGMFKSHGVATVNGELEVHKIAENMKDMDMIQGRKYLRDAALEHFGVPREIMGITESSNRSTSEAAQFIHAQNVLMPRLRRREEAINHQVLPFFGDNLIWRFDDIVPKNQEFDKTRGIEGWNSGLLTKDEGRELLGLPPSKSGGDVYKTQFSDVFIRVSDDPAAVSQSVMNVQFAENAPPMGEDDGMIEIVDGSEQKAVQRDYKAARLQAAQNSIEAARREQSRRFEIATLKYFREQNRRIVEVLNGGQKADRSIWDILEDQMPTHALDGGHWITLDAEERARLIDDFVLGLIDWEGEAELLKKMFEPLWKEAYDAGARSAQTLYNLTGIQRPELVSLAKIKGGARVKDILDTTKESISRIVTAGLENGDTRGVLAKQIEQEMGTTAGRARVIAAQECNASLNAGNADMMKRAGASFKTWHVTNMSVARDAHADLNGVTVPIDKPFRANVKGHGVVEIMFPCDPSCTYAGMVVNCHCFLTYDGF